MKNERILPPTALVLVTFLHMGVIALAWQIRQPAQVGMEQIEFIDLGDFGGGDGTPEGAGSPAPEESPPAPPQPEPPKPKVQPKPKPKPVVKRKDTIKPVITKKAKADIRKPKPEPDPKPEPKPDPKPKTPEKSTEDAAKKEEPQKATGNQVTAQNGTGNGAGRSETQGKGSGSNGTGTGRGLGRGEGSGSKTGSGHGSGSGGGTGAGSSRGNPNRATGSIPRPPYPPLSREMEEEGTVRLAVLVSPDGKVANVRIAKSSGHVRLDRAAQKAAQSGRFRPNGWTEYSVSVQFALRD
ncbi:energy transducer TonB [Neisseria montereyensis]|uniref:Protein TonB n=1 Tax=Neisseria montereyensis TaxID=2973938 RepID=A0ABT2FDG8_9NEIS|nr:energy transducer TonB [Neisseria montereyensis]MCS4534160.1 energy transducer TonB [Neisseria montereyensis]